MSVHVIEGARGFSGNAESAESAESAGIFEIPEGLLRGFLSLYGGFNDSPSSVMEEYIAKNPAWCVIDSEGTYSRRILAGVHPCLHLSTAPGGICEKRGECRKYGKYRDFRNFGRNP